MQDEWRKLQQLEAAVRLRALQCERAERVYQRSRSQTTEAERLFSVEQQRYSAVEQCLATLGSSGMLLDPAQHEQRLLAQAGAYQALQRCHAVAAQACIHEQETKSRWLECKRAEELAEKARIRVLGVLKQYLQGQQAIDIFDAQQAQGACYGT